MRVVRRKVRAKRGQAYGGGLERGIEKRRQGRSAFLRTGAHRAEKVSGSQRQWASVFQRGLMAAGMGSSGEVELMCRCEFISRSRGRTRSLRVGIW